MRIAVMDSGGVGGYFGARLAAGGAKGIATPLNRAVADILALHAEGKAP